MKNLIYVPLERLQGRYTEHLDRDVLSYLRESDIEDWRRIAAPYSNAPAAGQFLNASATIMNKSQQMLEIAKLYGKGEVTNETTFFFSDLWFPGIESLLYLNHFYKVKPTITGVFHAGSWTETDEVRAMEGWACSFEETIFQMCSKIFLGSEFIRRDIIKKRDVGKAKLIVTGLPLDSRLKETPPYEKENICVFNGRLHPEKQPELFEELKLRFRGKDWKFISTQELNLTKQQYYTLLARSKVVVSFALQENFGYGIQEAVKLGCIPVVPNRLSYVEQFTEYNLYNTFEECVDKVARYMEQYLPNFYVPETPNNNQIFNQWFSL